MKNLKDYSFKPIDPGYNYNIFIYRKTNSIEHKTTDVIYASEKQILALLWFSNLRTHVLISAWLLTIATLCLFLYWHYLHKDLHALTTWQSVALFSLGLIQASASCNSWIVYYTVFKGLFKPELQFTLNPDATDKEIRQELLFLEALCKGSYTVSIALILFVGLFTTYLYTHQPFIWTSMTLALLSGFLMPNSFSTVLLYFNKSNLHFIK